MKLSAARRRTLVQFLKFGVIGFAGFILDNAFVYFGIYKLGLGRIAAGLFSFPFVVTFTWIGNRLFTFHDAPKSRMSQQWLKFAMACAVGLVFNRGTYSLLVNNVPLVYAWPTLELLAGTAAGMFFNFFVAKKLVFR